MSVDAVQLTVTVVPVAVAVRPVGMVGGWVSTWHGGGVMESADLVLPGLNRRVGRMAWTVPRGRVEVTAAALGNRAAALGAAFHPSLEATGD